MVSTRNPALKPLPTPQEKKKEEKDHPFFCLRLQLEEFSYALQL